MLALRNTYHGRAFATVGVTGNRGWSASALSPVKVSYVHGGYRYRSPFAGLSDADYIKACVEDLRDVLLTVHLRRRRVHDRRADPGRRRLLLAPDGLFGAFAEVLAETGILLISDEVQTGWGRTGDNFWGIQAHGVTPDMMTFAKGLGNGLAIGGVVARGELMDALGANSISTFGGNPVSTVGARAVLDYLVEHDLQANAATLGTRLLGGLREVAAKYPVVGDVRGKGLMVGVELVEPGTMTPAPKAAVTVLEETRRRGLLVGKGGLHNNVIRLAPPMTLTAEELAEALDILTGAIDAPGGEQPRAHESRREPGGTADGAIGSATGSTASRGLVSRSGPARSTTRPPERSPRSWTSPRSPKWTKRSGRPRGRSRPGATPRSRRARGSCSRSASCCTTTATSSPRSSRPSTARSSTTRPARCSARSRTSSSRAASRPCSRAGSARTPPPGWTCTRSASRWAWSA